MTDEWKEAVAGGDAKKLSDLVLLATGSKPDTALTLLRSCVELLEKNTATGSSQACINGQALAPSSGDGSAAPALLTLENVQLLQPRGRFDLVFRKDGLTVTGKAGAAVAAWDNVRHIIRVPRPEGFNWGKALNPDDPAGSDLLAIPLKDPVPFRKSKMSLLLLQPDPKAQHSEASIVLDGVSHQVSGSQGTLVMSALKLLSGVRQVSPDKGLFASRDGKSFVKCYHGVNEGSLFPLKQGLLFMKPALFLPRSVIEEVVCGRGGSATTRYVDLVVGLEVEDGAGGTAASRQEFSNIDREALPSLQSYIQDALVAPRQREVKRAAKAEAAAAAAVATTEQPPTASSLSATNTATTASNATAAAPPTANGSASAAAVPAGAPPGVLQGVGGGKGAENAAGGPCKTGQGQENDEEEDEDDGDDESDEDFAPVDGDTDSDDDSGSDPESDPGGGNRKDDDDDDDRCSESDNDRNDEESDDEDDYDDDDAGGDGSDRRGPDLAAKRAEVLKELDDLAEEAAGGGGTVNSCLDSTDFTNYRCQLVVEDDSFTASLELDGCEITDEDVAEGSLAACFDATGRANITNLSMKYNNLTTLPEGAFQDLNALQRLWVSDNALASLPGGVFQGLAALQELYLGHNQLVTLPAGVVEDLTALFTLRLNNNQLSSLPEGVFENATGLSGLYLESNEFATLPVGTFQGLTSLRWLWLGDNGFTSLPEGVFANLTVLYWLFLNDNALETLPEGVFEGLTDLHGLYLSENLLTTLPEGVFQGLTSLSYIYLQNNELTSLPERIFQNLTDLRRLDLSGNCLESVPSIPA
eukprot:g13865.t1